jgi:hypothetical protein
MAFDPLPPSWIEGWTEDGTNLTIPIASIPELKAEEADPTEGDIRKCFFALCDAFWAAYNDTLAADRPTQMAIFKSPSSNVAEGTETMTYTFRFTTVVPAGGREVADEPVA